MKTLSLLLCFVSFGGSTFAQSPKPPFAVAISPEDSQVMSGFPVRVKILLTNISSHPISGSHELGELDRAYRYEVRDGSGSLITPTLHDGHGQTSSESITLKPGGSITGITNLSAAFDLTRPGEYTIRLGRPISYEPGAEVIKSNIITVTVTEAMPFTLNISGYSDGKPGLDNGLTAKAGANIGINIEKKNVSKQEIDCSTAVNNFTELDDKFHYEIRDSNGEIVPPRAIPQPDYPYTRGADRTTPCKTGESAWSGNVNLTKVYDLTQPGKYTVQIWQHASNNPRDGVVKSNKLALTVTP